MCLAQSFAFACGYRFSGKLAASLLVPTAATRALGVDHMGVSFRCAPGAVQAFPAWLDFAIPLTPARHLSRSTRN